MIDALDLTDAAGASIQRRQFWLPARRIGRDLHDSIVHDMRVDHAAAVAIMPAGAGDHHLARARDAAGDLVEGVGIGHGRLQQNPYKPSFTELQLQHFVATKQCCVTPFKFAERTPTSPPNLSTDGVYQ